MISSADLNIKINDEIYKVMYQIIRSILIILFSLFCCGSYAQGKLKSEQFFDGQYNSSDKAIVTILKGKKLSPYNLSLYHSITLSDSPYDILKIRESVLEDAKSGLQVEQITSGEEVLACYIQFKPLKDKDINRFLLFRSSDYSNGTIIYMEGDTDLDSLIKLFITKK